MFAANSTHKHKTSLNINHRLLHFSSPDEKGLVRKLSPFPFQFIHKCPSCCPLFRSPIWCQINPSKYFTPPQPRLWRAREIVSSVKERALYRGGVGREKGDLRDIKLENIMGSTFQPVDDKPSLQNQPSPSYSHLN
eukprot:sb/3474599/